MLVLLGKVRCTTTRIHTVNPHGEINDKVNSSQVRIVSGKD